MGTQDRTSCSFPTQNGILTKTWRPVPTAAIPFGADSRHIALISAHDLLCDLRDAGISVAPAGDRLAVSARGSIPEQVRVRLQAEKASLLRLLAESAQIAEAQTEEIIGRRVEAGIELLWEMELAGRTEEAEYTRHLAMFLVVLCALVLSRSAPLAF